MSSRDATTGYIPVALAMIAEGGMVLENSQVSVRKMQLYRRVSINAVSYGLSRKKNMATDLDSIAIQGIIMVGKEYQQYISRILSIPSDVIKGFSRIFPGN